MSDIKALEARIAARQQSLGSTVDELAGRLAPQALLEQNASALKARFAAVTTTDTGELRIDRIAIAAAAVAALVALRVWGGRRRKSRRG